MKKFLLASLMGMLISTLAFGVDIKSQIGMQDLNVDTDGAAHGTFQRRTSTGGTITLDKIDGNQIPWSLDYSRTIRPGNITGNSTGRIQNYTIGSASYTDNVRANDLITRGPWVDVRAYGAVPSDDITTDDAAFIDNAVNAAGNAGGGVVFVPDGEYILATKSTRTGTSNSYIVPRDNVTILMAPGAVLKVKAGQNTTSVVWNVIYTTALLTNFKVIGGKIDGGSNALSGGWTARSNTFIGSTAGGYKIHIYDVTFQNIPGNNPVAFSGTTGTRGQIVVERCRFIDGGSGMSGNSSTDHSSIYLLGSNNKVINNWFKSQAHVVGAAWENHGIDFEAHGNYVNGYSVGYWLTSESGNCRTIKTHDNIFDNVYQVESYAVAATNNNGFGIVDFYNNVVRLSTDAAAGGAYYILYGPDPTTHTNEFVDQWNVYGNTFIGTGDTMRVLGTIGAKRLHYYNNYAENFGSYGILFSTSVHFAATYSNYMIDLHNNTYKNFKGQPIVDIGGGRVKWLSIQGEKVISDNAVGLSAIYLRTNADGGLFSGNFIDNAYDPDIDFGANMANVAVDHRLTNSFSRTGNWAANGSRVIDPATNTEYTKIATGNTWRAIISDNVTAGHTCDAAAMGDRILNTGTDNITTWYCNGTAWFEN